MIGKGHAICVALSQVRALNGGWQPDWRYVTNILILDTPDNATKRFMEKIYGQSWWRFHSLEMFSKWVDAAKKADLS